MFRNPTPESFRQTVHERIAKAGTPRDTAAKNIGVSRPTLNDWEKSGDLRISQLAALARASGEAIVLRFDPEPADITKQAAPPEWAERLSAQIISEVQLNRQAIREAIVGSGEDEDAALVELVKDDLRPLFQELATQFRAEVRQLLDARFDGTEPE